MARKRKTITQRVAEAVISAAKPQKPASASQPAPTIEDADRDYQRAIAQYNRAMDRYRLARDTGKSRDGDRALIQIGVAVDRQHEAMVAMRDAYWREIRTRSQAIEAAQERGNVRT